MILRILAVDDDPNTTHGLKGLLEARSCLVEEVNDPTLALAAALRFQPHVVILDYLMPGMHGGDVAWQLASDPQLRDARLIVCSGYVSSELPTKLPPRRIPIIEKPVDPGELLRVIEECTREVG